MTKQEKIIAVGNAMVQDQRKMEQVRDGAREVFYHFTDETPEEFQDLFLKHFEVRDMDYEIFMRACTIVREIYADNADATDEQVEEKIFERSQDTASIWTADRLAYLSANNEDEVSKTMLEHVERSISTACATWYDSEVEQAAIIIKNWVNA